MSTHAQIRIIGVGCDVDAETVSLYRDCDGYPTQVLGQLAKAYQIKYGYKLGIPGKIASMICSTDPAEFETQRSLDFQSDIRWFYEIVAVNHHQGAPTWKVRVFRTLPSFRKAVEAAIEAGNPHRVADFKEHLYLAGEGDVLALPKQDMSIENLGSEMYVERLKTQCPHCGGKLPR